MITREQVEAALPKPDNPRMYWEIVGETLELIGSGYSGSFYINDMSDNETLSVITRVAHQLLVQYEIRGKYHAK